MLRGNNVVCGTSSTGTGTLTLAACPTAIGGLDFDTWARAAIQAANSQTISIPYQIIEYTDATFATPKQIEFGLGFLILGASAGIANCTLSREYILEKQTGLNTTPAVVFGTTNNTDSIGNNAAGLTGITIGTAANTLVMISTDVRDVAAPFRAYDNGYEHICVNPGWTQIGMASGTAVFFSVWLQASDYIKSASVGIPGTAQAVSSPTSSSLEIALYDFVKAQDNNGFHQGYAARKIVDFGVNTASNPAGQIGQVGCSLSTAVFVPAGWYMAGILYQWVGGTGAPAPEAATPLLGGPQGNSGTGGGNSGGYFSVAGLTSLIDNPFASQAYWGIAPSGMTIPRMTFANY